MGVLITWREIASVYERGELLGVGVERWLSGDGGSQILDRHMADGAWTRN